jgi:hypothetical protein
VKSKQALINHAPLLLTSDSTDRPQPSPKEGSQPKEAVSVLPRLALSMPRKAPSNCCPRSPFTSRLSAVSSPLFRHAGIRLDSGVPAVQIGCVNSLKIGLTLMWMIPDRRVNATSRANGHPWSSASLPSPVDCFWEFTHPETTCRKIPESICWGACSLPLPIGPSRLWCYGWT